MFRHNQAYSGTIHVYSGILRILWSPRIFKTLAYLEPSLIDPDENYIFLTNQFLKVVNQHAHLKVNILS